MKELAITFLCKGILPEDDKIKLKERLQKHFGTERVLIFSCENFVKSELIITEVIL